MPSRNSTPTKKLAQSSSLALNEPLPVSPAFLLPQSSKYPTKLPTAGADIKEMKDLTFSAAYGNDFIEMWSDLTTRVKKPIIAAVNGYALGGGCELAMMTDIIYCSTSATFGQPEIKLGTIPGAGGSQRLTRAIGKSRAMELILTGNNFSGKQAGEWGLAAKVFENAEECLNGAISTAEKIAGMSRIAVKAAKEVVNKSQDLGVKEGVEFERRVFHSLFGSRDQKIGRSLDFDWNIFGRFLMIDYRYDGFCGKEEAGMVTRIKSNEIKTTAQEELQFLQLINDV